MRKKNRRNSIETNEKGIVKCDQIRSYQLPQADEDIPTDLYSPFPSDDIDVAANNKSNEIRIGPMTRARAKLLNQQVNSILCEFSNLIDENFILPKSMYLCMIRFIGEEGVARQSEEL